MSVAIIHGENIGNEYHHGLVADVGQRHSLERFVRSPLSVFRRNNKETFWALNDMSLVVREGEVRGLRCLSPYGQQRSGHSWEAVPA